MTKKLHFTILFAVINLFSYAQEFQFKSTKIPAADSIYLINLPQLELPDLYKSPDAPLLPSVLDNSELPYFRPVFMQDGWSCGQAASIGYNFTYEINRARNVAGNTFVNQYPTQFAFNFYNDGIYEQGVGYFHSFDLLKSNGTPNVYDYGEMGGSHLRWLSGYDKYYNGMFNRVADMYSIYVGDEEGFLTLKYWLYDHLIGSPDGGVANFYSDVPALYNLPPGTPEEGKFVVPFWGSYNGHAMTIIGWNDSIRWDYNNDGQYTNHIDINGDGVVNMKDWEIGGMKFANSWGEDWADSGFCYMMYKTLAEEKFDGGIWNKSVHIINVKGDYSPRLTFKVNLKHNSRHKIKVIAGVSADTTDVWPAHTMDFALFNYQGGDHYMRGNDTINQHKTIIFGLDVTPLLSFVINGEPAKFFLQIHEHDPINVATGDLIYFALMDYINGGLEIACPDTDVPLIENGYTTLAVIHTLTFDDIIIETEELPAFIPGQQFTCQITATGGTEPYNWDILTRYSENQFENNYPNIQGQQIIPNSSTSGYVTQSIGFSFPFYGESHDTIIIHTDGFLMFNEIKYPLPYQVDDMLLFKYEPMAALFLNRDLQINASAGDGLWYEGDENHASFRWIVTLVDENGEYPLDFTAILYPDGRIEYYYDNFENSEYLYRITGVSNGDGINYEIAEFSNLLPAESQQVVTYTPQNYLSSMNINDDGLLTVFPEENNKIYDITIKATDYNNISTEKTYQLSDGIVFDFSVVSGDDDRIDYGETPVLSFNVKNISNQPINNVALDIQISDPFISMLDSTEYIGTVNPGQTINLADAISFSVDTNVPDEYDLSFSAIFNSTNNFWESKFNLTAYSPILIMGNPIVDDNDNGKLDPGETANLIIPVNNYGHSTANGVEGYLNTVDPYITFNGPGQFIYGNIPKGGTACDTINLTVAGNTPQGHLTYFDFSITALPDFMIYESFVFLIGRFPVLIVDMDPELLSGPVIKSTIEELNVLFDYENYIPNELNVYQNILVVLGRKFGQHILTEVEGQRLADFLNAGGNIYMEGGMTWFDDPQTAVHPLFNIETEAITWTLNDSVFGISETFTEGMVFDYAGAMPFYDYYLAPIPVALAFTILHGIEEEHGFAVAFDNGNYKTIGSILDFSGLDDGMPPSTKKNFMAKILEFFGVDGIITSEKCKSSVSYQPVLSSYPNPFSGQTTINFNLAEEDKIDLSIYDIHGNKITTIISEKKFPAGLHSVKWEGNNITNGIYICHLKTKGNISCLKIVKK